MNSQAVFTLLLVSAYEQTSLFMRQSHQLPSLPSSREASKGGVMPNTKLLNTIKVDGCQIFYGN